MRVGPRPSSDAAMPQSTLPRDTIRDIEDIVDESIKANERRHNAAMSKEDKNKTRGKVEKSVRSIFGPHLAGDSLDMAVDSAGKATILTGSWRPEGPLEMWDFETGTLAAQVVWKASLIQNQPCML